MKRREDAPQPAIGEGDAYIRSVQRVCDILDLLRWAPAGLSLTRIAESSGMPISTVSRYLSNLESRQYIERDATTGDYRLGLSVLAMHEHGLELLKQRTTPHLTRIRDQLGETVNLGVLYGGRVLYVVCVESLHGVRHGSREGDRDALHSTALGKAIASQLPSEQLRELLTGEGMPQRTSFTIADLELFLKDVAESRERGFMLDDRENEPDVRCVGVPLHGLSVPAALSISGPASRVGFGSAHLEEMAAALRAVAAEITDQIGLPASSGADRESDSG